MFSFIFQLSRLFSSFVSGVSEAVSKPVTQAVATITAITAIAVPLRIAVADGGVGMSHNNSNKSKTENTITHTPKTTVEKSNTMAFSVATEISQNVKSVTSSGNDIEPAKVDNNSITFSEPTAEDIVSYSPEQMALSVLVENVRQSGSIGRDDLLKNAIEINADLVFDHETADKGYYDPIENQANLSHSDYYNNSELATVAEATLVLKEELAHIGQNKDSLFVHDYLNDGQKFDKFTYFSPEGYIHMRRHREATAKIKAFMAFSDWGKTPEGKSFVDAYVAEKNDYMAEAFKYYQETLDGRLDDTSKIMAAFQTYKYMMHNDRFLHTYDRRLDKVPNQVIWKHPDGKKFIEPTHEMLLKAGNITINGNKLNFLASDIDLTSDTYREYRQATRDWIVEKSQEINAPVPDFVPSENNMAIYTPSSSPNVFGSHASFISADSAKSHNVNNEIVRVTVGESSYSVQNVSPESSAKSQIAQQLAPALED